MSGRLSGTEAKGGGSLLMPNTKDLKIEAKMRLLVYGKSGIGKTWGALTFPRPLFLDFDGGIKVVKHPEFVAQHGQVDVEYEQFVEKNLVRGIAQTANAFDDATRWIESQLKPGNRDKFDTIVLDSATTALTYGRNKALIVLQQLKISHTHQLGMQHGLLPMRIQDWGAQRSMIEQFIDVLLATDKRIVVICHEKEVTNDDGDLIEIRPLLTGKSDEEVPLKFDEVYNIQIRRKGPKWERYLVTEPDGVRKVKSRLGIANGTAWDYESLAKQFEQIGSDTTQTKEK